MKQKDNFDFGSVQIHKKVIAEIVASVIDEMEGVRLSEKSFSTKLFNLFGCKNFSGINIKMDENQDVNIEVMVFVRYGINIPDIARQIQEEIKSAIEKTVDIVLKNININIRGIERGQK